MSEGQAPTAEPIQSAMAVSSAVIGVAMTPGATALSGMWAPAHSGVGAWRRTHRANACLAASTSAMGCPML